MRNPRLLTGVLTAVLAFTFSATAVAQPEPSGPHPRLFVDQAQLETLRAHAKKKGSAVQRAIAQCDEKTRKLEVESGYEGFLWGSHLTACAVAWQATKNKSHAKTGLVYFKAMLDDRNVIGDGKGGDTVVRHDHGYAMRTFAAYSAIGYDWLWDAPGMTDPLKARARRRFKVWADWYRDKGYLKDLPGANYHAGYVGGATFSAIAMGSEGGAVSAALWSHMVTLVWQRAMRTAADPAKNGVLVGGDWPEGWQYGPLSVIEYALGAREMIRQGVDLPEFEAWGNSLLLRHIHGLTPATDEYFLVGDTGNDTVHISPGGRVLTAVVAGPADAKHRAWARAEAARMRLEADEFAIWDVLREIGTPAPEPFPRASKPTSYFAPGAGNFYSRNSWSRGGVATMMHCNWQRVADHEYVDAGNFVMVRGGDNVIVDPSPYGARTTMTTNAPTVESAHLPATYLPSQGFWGKNTRFLWTRQTASGIATARCDYEDQYEFKQYDNSVKMAVRDFVLIPDGNDQAAVIIDRARTGDAEREMYLRFRTLGALKLAGSGANAQVGASRLFINKAFATSGTPDVRTWKKGACYDPGDHTQGNCALGRFIGDEYRLVVKGPEPMAVHVVDAVDYKASASKVTPIDKPGYRAVVVERGDRITAVVAPTRVIGATGGTGSASAELTYQIPASAGHHVVLDAPRAGGKASVTAQKSGADCAVTVKPGGDHEALPLVFAIDGTCKVSADADLTMPLAASDLPQNATTGGDSDGSSTGESPGSGGANRSGAGGGDSGKGSARGCGCHHGGAEDLGLLLVLGLGFAAIRLRRRPSGTRR